MDHCLRLLARTLDLVQGLRNDRQIVSATGGLATSYIDGKTAIQKANEIKLKQAIGEMDWEQVAISASNNSFKDELGQLFCLHPCC